MAKRTLDNLSTQDLQAELDRRQRQLPILEDRRNKLLAQLRDVEEQIGTFSHGQPTTGRGTGRGKGRRTKTRRRRVRNQAPLGEVLAGILRRDEPMKVSDIVDRVVASGYKTNSANFSTIVNQTLLKDDRFRSVSRGHYVLA